MSVKLLAEQHLKFLSLKVGCTGSSEPTLVKIPHCWKSHVTAHFKTFTYQKKSMCVVNIIKLLFLPQRRLNCIYSAYVGKLGTNCSLRTFKGIGVSNIQVYMFDY